MICSHRPNVFMDVSAYQSKPLANLRNLLSQGINHKVVFGSDWPVFRLQGNQKETVDALLSHDGPLCDLLPVDLERFFRQNLEQLIPVPG